MATVLRSVRKLGEERRHLLLRFEIELRVLAPEVLGRVERGAVLDGDHDVLQSMSRTRVIVDVVRRDDIESELPRERDKALVAPPVAVDEVVLQLDKKALAAEELAVAFGDAARARHVAQATRCRSWTMEGVSL
jgi:hypothetical protein